MTQHKKILVVLSMFAFVLLGIAAGKPSQFQKERNLKVLPKDISDEALDSIMDGFKVALGVKCNYCHKRDEATKDLDFASDDKPEKEIARHMMRMTIDINKKYFNYNNVSDAEMIEAVGCKTCHRGQPHPSLNEIDTAQ
jgi:hypothetical protein